MSSSRLSPASLEKLFLDKLTEKYTLNIRNLKKAFLCYDHDKNGLLDLNELERFISSYCNGVHSDDVKVLVNKYDRNKDGYISYEELLDFLTNRTATNGVDGMTTVPAAVDNHVFRGISNKNERSEKSKLLKEQYKRNETDLKISKAIDEVSNEVKSRPKYGAATRSKQQDDVSETSSNRSLIITSSKPIKAIPTAAARSISPPPMSEISSTITSSDVQSTLDPSNPRHLEYRCKIVVQNLRAVLLKMAADMRVSGKIQNRLSMTTPVLLETVACKILLKEFKTFPDIVLEMINGKEGIVGLPYDSFVELLNHFKAPGSGPIRSEIGEFLFELCIQDNSLNPPVANPYQLITLLFGKIPNTVIDGLQRLKLEQPESPTRAGVSKNRKEPPPVGMQPTTHNGVYIYGSNGGGNKHTEISGKNDVKKGSLAAQMDQGRQLVATGPFKDPLSDSYETSRADAIMAVPLRFISRKSKTALVCPTNFDVSLLKRSAVLPSYSTRINHVFGMSVSITSGNMMHALPTSGSTGALVYAAAGVGVVHDLETNTQKIYNGHYDDITCITISGDGRLAGTGCCGKKGDAERDLLIHVWDVTASSNVPLITLGKGFFDRFISAVGFSFDGKYISGISGDDAHTMGIWHIETGQLVTTATVQKGLAPQVKCLMWSSEQQYTEYITSSHSGLCDLLLTTGEHHIKLWSFRRPVSTGMELGGLKEASVQYKELSLNKLSKSGHKPPKVSTCGAFLSCADKTNDVVVGGSNGSVYLFKKGELIANVAAIKGGVFTLQVMNDKVICGGSQGIIKLLDGRTLNILVSYSISGSVVETPRGGSVISDAEEQHTSDINYNSHDILGVAIFNGGGRGSSSVIKAYATTANGKMVRLDFTNTAVTKNNVVNYYHVGPVTAVCTESNKGGRLVVTGGDDRRLCVWDATTRSLLVRCNTKGSVRCCHFDRNSSFIAVGSADGSISIYNLSNGKEYSLTEVSYRKDSKEVISDIKFSPNNEYVAAGSHDGYIYVYNCALETSGTMKALYKLKGHSAYITHLDWSIDSLLLQSTCGAYELLFWDIRSGTLLKGEFNTSDIKWKTNHCILGFNVMGMWRPYSDGTDINAIDVHKEKGLMVTADDFGKLNMLNYPSVVKSAPCRSYNGHTSHVSNVRFLDRRDGNTTLVTVGGRDCTVMLWNIDEIIVEKSRTLKDYNNKL
jgi:WD40 repeat protein